MSDLERQLEDELRRVLDPISAQPIPPRRALGRRASARTMLGGAGAALSFKLLTGVAVAAAAVTVAGAATTGSINPMDWGRQVSEQVEACKAALAAGQHGIGECVSDFANQHGQAVASAARLHGNDSNGTPTDSHGNNPNANDHAKDKKKSRDPQVKGTSSQDPTDPPIRATVTPPPQP